MTESNKKPEAEIARIMESAQRLGVEVNEADAIQWLTNMATTKEGDEITMDKRSGVFGHNITMLDFSQQELEYFRRIGKLVEFEDIPGKVETALALSGSAAQSKIQSYPGDCDYFERVNIIAPSREDACQILGKIMREKALNTVQASTYQLIEVKFGSYPEDMVIGEIHGKASIHRSPGNRTRLGQGKLRGSVRIGTAISVTWDETCNDPGWCKLDWVVADPIRKKLANASNMLDVTWEGPDGLHYSARWLSGSIFPGGIP